MSRKPSPLSRTATPVDRAIAKNLRAIRERKCIGQVALGDAVGVTFQQIQKYESAQNRVSASRLYDIAKALNEPLMRFYDGAP